MLKLVVDPPFSRTLKTAELKKVIFADWNIFCMLPAVLRITKTHLIN